MELVNGISLLSFLKSKQNHRMSDRECADIYSQIFKGMEFLHDKNIFHRDIKLENIIVENSHKVKIIDFGFSICVESTKLLNFFCGTPSYMPPEIVQKKDYTGNFLYVQNRSSSRYMEFRNFAIHSSLRLFSV